MLFLAILPRAWSVIALAEVTETGRAILATSSFQLENKIEGKLRIYDVPRAVEDITRQVFDMLGDRTGEVRRVAIDIAVSRTSQLPEVSAAVKGVLAEDFEVSLAEPGWRALGDLGVFTSMPYTDEAYRSIKDCYRLLAYSIAKELGENEDGRTQIDDRSSGGDLARRGFAPSPERSAIGDSSAANLGHLPTGTNGQTDRHADPSPTQNATLASAGTRTSADVSEADDRRAGYGRTATPRVPPWGVGRLGGIDPGASKLAVVVIEKYGDLWNRRRFIARRTWRVGEIVKLKKPRVITRAGEKLEVSTKHSLTAEHLDRLRAEVVAFLRTHNVTHVAIEHAEYAHTQYKNGDGGARAAAITAALIKTSFVDEALRGACRDAGLEVKQVAGATWRAKVAGRTGRGGSGAELVPESVNAAIDGWVTAPVLPQAIGATIANWARNDRFESFAPLKVEPVVGAKVLPPNEHEYDAAGVAVWLDLELFPVVKPKKSQGSSKQENDEPKEPKKQRTKTRDAKLALEAKKKAAGCTCTRKHSLQCPLSNRFRWWEKRT